MKKYAFIFAGIIVLVFTVFYFRQRNATVQQKSVYNLQLARQLDSIYQLDQKQRMRIDSFRKVFGAESKELGQLFRDILKQDSTSIMMVSNILDKYGWMGKDKIGENGNLALFSIVHHGSLTVKKKYLPLLKEAVKLGNAEASDCATLEDAILVDSGEKQIYGTQLAFDNDSNKAFVIPLEDPMNVDKRRHNVGLIPMKQYVKLSKIDWDAYQYMKDLPQIEILWKRLNKK
ncbi:MAG: DUF6624 domain-containing protein [Bacteroidota bacterium]